MADLLGKAESFKNMGIIKNIKELISSLKKVVCHTIENSIKLEGKGVSFVSKNSFYSTFTQTISELRAEDIEKSVSIITFNYDIVIDLSLEEKKLDFEYFLSDNAKSEITPLLKLHGSLNWRQCSSCKKVQYFQILNYLIQILLVLSVHQILLTILRKSLNANVGNY